MKNLRKLVIASFMLVIAFVAVVSSTYAWFTRGTDATVSQIEIGVVDANKSILISKDNNTWVRELDLNFAGKITPTTIEATNSGTEQAPVYGLPTFKQIIWSNTLVPSYAAANPLPDKDLASYEQYEVATEYDDSVNYYTRSGEAGSYVYTGVSVANATAFNAGTFYTNKEDLVGYITFDLYFQLTVANPSDWDGTYLHMDLTGLDALNFDAQGDLTETHNNDAVSSFRMAVAYNGALATILEQQVADTDDQTAGDQPDGRYGSGRQFDINNAWMKKMENSFVAPNDAQNATHYVLNETTEQAVYSLTKTHDTATGADHYEYDLSIPASDTAAADGCVYVSGDGLTRTYKLTVYVWMEGWDGDNVNAAARCQYQFGLSFRAE